MTNADAIKIAAVIREQVDATAEDHRPSAVAVRDALTAVAGAIGDMHAAVHRMPASAKMSFMDACGL